MSGNLLSFVCAVFRELTGAVGIGCRRDIDTPAFGSPPQPSLPSQVPMTSHTDCAAQGHSQQRASHSLLLYSVSLALFK